MQELYNFLNTFSVNIDLALEAKDLIRGATGREISGVTEEKQAFSQGTVTVVRILDQQAEAVMGKPMGTYITIEAPNLKYKSPEVEESVSQILAKHLKDLLKIPANATVFLVGLGNWQATPDALGPMVIKNSLVTRHLHLHMPQAVTNYRPVCAFAPGVLGITGIETAEIIQGIVEKIHPSLIIAIDSLAATNVGRVGTTIQISDTGISPGSGVNNQRIGINQHTMGVPVIAIGVPTVVNAAIIAKTALEFYHRHFSRDALNSLGVQQTLEEVFNPFQGGLIVTPREVDDLVLNAGKTITKGLNMALHPQVSQEEIEALMI